MNNKELAEFEYFYLHKEDKTLFIILLQTVSGSIIYLTICPMKNVYIVSSYETGITGMIGGFFMHISFESAIYCSILCIYIYFIDEIVIIA